MTGPRPVVPSGGTPAAEPAEYTVRGGQAQQPQGARVSLPGDGPVAPAPGAIHLGVVAVVLVGCVAAVFGLAWWGGWVGAAGIGFVLTALVVFTVVIDESPRGNGPHARSNQGRRNRSRRRAGTDPDAALTGDQSGGSGRS